MVMHGALHNVARARQTLDTYFDNLRAAFTDLVRITASGTWIVQLIGFSDVSAQLPRYLRLLADVG